MIRLHDSICSPSSLQQYINLSMPLACSGHDFINLFAPNLPLVAPVPAFCLCVSLYRHYTTGPEIANGAESSTSFAIPFFLGRRIKINVYVVERARVRMELSFERHPISDSIISI